ncbi:MAG: hypothetical protein BRD40_02805, partial [Bacteroidetes bacterium QS_1_65_9]
GHTGYTGTSFWVDPAEELFVVLLTNRVYPDDIDEQVTRINEGLDDLIERLEGIRDEHVGLEV